MDERPDQRRTRRVTRRHILGSGSLAVAAALGLGYRSTKRPETEFLDLPLPGLPAEAAGTTIAVLSDTHVGRFATPDDVERGVELANQANPHLVLLLGDYCYGLGERTQSAFDDAIRPFARLRATYGVVAIPGNHDYWDGIDRVRVAFNRVGIPLLTNQRYMVSIPGGELAIVGLDDLWEGERQVDRAFEGIPAGMPRITLSHNPDRFVYERHRDLSLMLAGHTHGGQIILPGVGPLYVPCRYGWRYPMGHFRAGRNQLYVSRGLNCTIIPLRIHCPPEVTVITLAAPGDVSPEAA